VPGVGPVVCLCLWRFEHQQRLQSSGICATKGLAQFVFGHVGAAVQPVRPGCREARWSGETYLSVAQAWSHGRWKMADITPVGVLGDPTKASAEAGRALLAAEVPVYTEIVREALG
jgi:creatinine amidohydrolase/Fe(II)-dependent formamide hydrolase-like protein